MDTKGLLREGETLGCIPQAWGGRHAPRGRYHIAYTDPEFYQNWRGSSHWTKYRVLCGAELRSNYGYATDAREYQGEVECKACIKIRTSQKKEK